MPSSDAGSCGSRATSAPATSSATASALSQFRSAGTTCRGAASVDVSASQHAVVAGHEVVEVPGVGQVVRPGTCGLLRVLHALDGSRRLLLLPRDVQVALQDDRPGVGEQRLEGADVLGPAPPVGVRRDLAHADGHQVLVVRAVEDADRAAPGSAAWMRHR